MILHHYTNVRSYKDIKSSDFLLPLSPRSPLAKTFFLGSILPKSYKEKGIYCIRDEDLKKWNKDKFASDYLAKLKSKGGSLVKITFEVSELTPVEILEERIIFYDVFFSKNPFIPLGHYGRHIDSRISVEKYDESYSLPSAFVKSDMPFINIRADCTQIKYPEDFNKI